jgi:hypothetical protein
MLLMSVRQLGNVLWVANSTVLFGDICHAHIENVCGADCDVWKFVDVRLNDAMICSRVSLAVGSGVK